MFWLSYKVAQDCLPVTIGAEDNWLAQAPYLEVAEAGNIKCGKSIAALVYIGNRLLGRPLWVYCLYRGQ